MTGNDFMMIHIESKNHYKSESFYEEKKCNVSPRYQVVFDNGLLDFFKWYNYVVNTTDNYRFLLIKPDGTSITGKMSFNRDIYNAQKNSLLQTGVLSFPFKKTIPVINESSGEIVMELDDAFFASIWPGLSAHLNIDNGPDNPPPIQSPGPGDMKLNDKILIPETLARQFRHFDFVQENDSPEQDKATALINEVTEVKEFIIDKVRSLDKDGWKYIFRTCTDYETFLVILTNFCLSKPYTLPDEINLKKGCKTRFAKIFNTIYKEYRTTNLSRDTEYFKIIKVFNHFKNQTNNEIYKDITREKEII